MRSLLFVVIAALLAAVVAAEPTREGGEGRVRVRDLGVDPGILPSGPLGAITDVEGVRVGQVTLIEGDAVRTGVTAIVPHGGNLFQDKVAAGVHVANAFGKAAGLLQVEELGTIETPIVLTNTLSVGTAVEAVVRWTLEQPGNEEVRSVNAVVGETNDGYLNDIRGLHVKGEHVRRAIDTARPGPVAQGSVGAGSGTVALGWKGGIGTASRVLPPALGGSTVGALVQTNFGGVLRIDGIPVGELLDRYPYREELEAAPVEAAAGSTARDEGSIMIVLATDAPLSSRNLARLARRAVLALGRVGSFMSNGSGDFVVAFSTTHRIPYRSDERTASVALLRDEATSPLFLAAVEAVEEAIYDSLSMATTVSGRDGNTVEAIPLDRLRTILGAPDDGVPE